MVTPTKLIACGLVSAGLLAGTMADRVPERPPLTLGGERVLAADFHIHSATWSDGGLTPWGLVLEARRQGLDVIAVTGHNQVSDAKVARWFSRWVGGPTVLVGQEVLAPAHHVIAVGIEQVVDSTLTVARQVAAIHAQGGVAIAAHPTPDFWSSFDSEAIETLDGAEICHPLVYNGGAYQADFETFRSRGNFAAIGSSDFHGFGRMGMCRTFVFAPDDSPAAVLDAIRERQTVVYSPGGKAYGDPDLMKLAESHPELRTAATTDVPASVLDWISRIGVLAGLLVLSATGRGR